jgi:hypothetical protein
VVTSTAGADRLTALVPLGTPTNEAAVVHEVRAEISLSLID